MRLLFAAVNLILLCSFTQTKMVILQWRDMHAFFLSALETAELPERFLTDENLCKEAKTSNLFKGEYKIDTLSEEDQLLSPTIQRIPENAQLEQVGTSELNSDNRQPFPLADILLLADDEERSRPIRKDTVVMVDNNEILLSLFPCRLSDSKIIYLSKGYRKYIDVYFIFGKIRGNDIPTLLAAIGESQLEEKNVKDLPLEERLDEEYTRKFTQFENLNPTQYIWLCAVIQNHETKGKSRNYKLIISMWKYNPLLSYKSDKLLIPESHFPNIMYKVHDLNNESINVSINHIIQVFDKEEANVLFFNYYEAIFNSKYKYFHISSELLSHQ